MPGGSLRFLATTGSVAVMNRKSSTRNRHFPSAPSTHAALLASFRQQMADHARGEHLRKLRTELRLSQEDAAHEIGVSTKSLRTWEKGGPIKWENAKAAARFYEVDPEELVSREPGDLMESLNASQSEAPNLRRVEEAIEALRAETAESLDLLHAELRAIQRLLEPSGRKQKAARS